MHVKIHFCGSTVKQLEHLLRLAFRGGNVRVIQRISALLLLGDDHPVERVAERVGVCKQTIYNWVMPSCSGAGPVCVRARRPGAPPS